MRYSNFNIYLNESRACMFEYDEIDEMGEINTRVLPYFISVNGRPTINPLVSNIASEVQFGELPDKMVLQIADSSFETDESESKLGEIQLVDDFKYEKLEDDDNAEIEEDDDVPIFSLFEKILILASIGLWSYALGAFLRGFWPTNEHDSYNNQMKIITDDMLNSSNESIFDPNILGSDNNISYIDAIVDIKAIELEFEKYGLIDKTKDLEARNIRRGIASLYIRNNSNISAIVLTQLYKNNFIAKNPELAVNDSIPVTSLLLAYYENSYVNRNKDIFDASIFCKNDQTKQFVTKVFDMAREIYETGNKDIIQDHINTLMLYYKNLDAKDLPYYEDGNTSFSIINMGAHLVCRAATYYGYDEEVIQELEELITFGEVSPDTLEVAKVDNSHKVRRFSLI